MAREKKVVLVSRDSLRDMIHHAMLTDRKKLKDIVGRALVVIYKGQTATEQSTLQTVDENGIGFAGCDAESGSKTAQFYMERGTLIDWMVEKWIRNDGRGYPRICKYHRQLNDAAMLKAARKKE